RLLAAQGTRPPGRATEGGHSPDRLDQEKLLVTSTALRLRRAHPDWFAGGHRPLAAEGPAAGHAVAFLRGGHAMTVATRLPARLAAAGGWADTVLPLPGGHWRGLLTGATPTRPRPLRAAVWQPGRGPALRPFRLPVDGPRLARWPATRVGDLRTAHRHVHSGGDVRRGGQAPRPSARPRRGHGRADAGRGLPRQPRLGLRRDQPVGRP